MGDADLFRKVMRSLGRSAARLAWPDWQWGDDDTARISLYWDTDDEFSIEVDLYRAGDLARHRTYTGAEAVQFGLALMERAAE